jgi:hypothetical protein
MALTQVLRSNDPVLISFVTAYLKGHGIDIVVLDYHTSLLEGSIGAIPRRIMVDSDQAHRCRMLLREAEIDHDPAI